MTAKVAWLAVAAAVASLAGAAALCWVAADKRTSPYRELKAAWRIQGFCTNAQNGVPIKGAVITATFREPIAFRQHWRNPPALATTQVVTKTDHDGRFNVNGNGGSVYIKAQAEGFHDPEPWENWSCSARNGIDHIESNINFSLKPVQPVPK